MVNAKSLKSMLIESSYNYKRKHGKKKSIARVKKMLCLTVFLRWKQNCEQNLDLYCVYSADLKHKQFICVLTALKTLKWVLSCQINSFSVLMHPSYNKGFDQKPFKHSHS